MSKKSLEQRQRSLKIKLEELEKKARMDPLKKNKRLHEELAEVKKKLGK